MIACCKDSVHGFVLGFVLLLMLPLNNRAGGYSSAIVGADTFEVFVVQLDWHTGIVIQTADVNHDDWPEIELFSHRKYLSIGMGDEAFYQSDDNLIFLGFRAVLFPTSSVVRVIGFNAHPTDYYLSRSRIVRMELDRESYGELIRSISGAFRRTENGNMIKSNFGDSDIYYMARGYYHAFNTCNTWMARLFKRAGFDLRVAFVLTSRQLFRQLKRLPNVEEAS